MSVEQPWHVLGAGAIGCLFAGYLAEAGRHPVLLVRDRAPKLSPQKQTTLCIERNSIHREHRVAVSNCSDNDPIRYLLITTKAYDVIPALHSIATRLNPQAVVLLLVNGLGLAEAIKEHYPALQLYCGTTTEGVYRLSRHHICHAGTGATRIGKHGCTTAPPWLTDWPVASANCSWEPAIEHALWQKIAINCAINPLTALHRCNNGQLLKIPEAAAACAALVAEIAHVSKAAGYPEIAQALPEQVRLVIESTAANQSSMLQDVMANRRTEIDYINGYLQKVARRYNIPTPYNDAIYTAMLSLQA